MKLPIRRRATPLRDRPIQRASAGLSAIRAAAALALLAVSGSLYTVTATDDFRLDPAHITVEGAVYTAREVVDTSLGYAEAARPNLFRIRTSDLAESLRLLPAVLDAEVRVLLPDRLTVRLTERAPILTWQTGDARYLVDVDGVLFARVDSGAEHAAPASPGLPTVTDRRERSALPVVGERLDPIDLAAVRQLAAVTPAMVGSGANALRVTVDDAEGFTIDALPDLWHAVFGFYTAHLRSTDIIPGQVQCLGALLGSSEASIRTIHLAPEDQRCGTFRARSGSSTSAPRRSSPSTAEPSGGSSASPAP